MHAKERAQASVAAVELHVHQSAGDRIKARATVSLDVLADDPELPDPPDQRPGHLGSLPVARDHGEDLVIDQGADATESEELRVAELLADEEVVGRSRVGEVVGQRGDGGTHAALLDS